MTVGLTWIKQAALAGLQTRLVHGIPSCLPRGQPLRWHWAGELEKLARREHTVKCLRQCAGSLLTGWITILRMVVAMVPRRNYSRTEADAGFWPPPSSTWRRAAGEQGLHPPTRSTSRSFDHSRRRRFNARGGFNAHTDWLNPKPQGLKGDPRSIQPGLFRRVKIPRSRWSTCSRGQALAAFPLQPTPAHVVRSGARQRNISASLK